MHDPENGLANQENNLESVFRKQILSFQTLLASGDSDKVFEDSFSNLPAAFFGATHHKNVWRTGVLEKWLPVFKTSYHKLLADRLSNQNLENAVVFSFLQLDETGRDYMTWYYEDAFSPEQISAITGQPLLSVGKKIWQYRKELQDIFSGCNTSFSTASPDEERFRRLTAYFNDTLPVAEAAENVSWLAGSDADAHRSDVLELLLRQQKGTGGIQKSRYLHDGNAYLTADDFLQYAKAKIQQRNNSIS